MLRMAGGRPLMQELMQRPLLDPAAVDEMDAAIRAGRRPPIERGAFIEGIGEGILRLIRRDYGLPQDPLTIVRGGTQGPVRSPHYSIFTDAVLELSVSPWSDFTVALN